MGLQIENYAEFERDVERAIKKIVDETTKSFEQLVDATVSELQSAAGGTQGGSTAGTIHKTGQQGANKIVYDVGPSGEGFILVFSEFGATTTPLQPWLRPSLDTAFAGWRPW